MNTSRIIDFTSPFQINNMNYRVMKALDFNKHCKDLRDQLADNIYEQSISILNEAHEHNIDYETLDKANRNLYYRDSLYPETTISSGGNAKYEQFGMLIGTGNSKFFDHHIRTVNFMNDITLSGDRNCSPLIKTVENGTYKREIFDKKNNQIHHVGDIRYKKIREIQHCPLDFYEILSLLSTKGVSQVSNSRAYKDYRELIIFDSDVEFDSLDAFATVILNCCDENNLTPPTTILWNKKSHHGQCTFRPPRDYLGKNSITNKHEYYTMFGKFRPNQKAEYTAIYQGLTHIFNKYVQEHYPEIKNFGDHNFRGFNFKNPFYSEYESYILFPDDSEYTFNFDSDSRIDMTLDVKDKCLEAYAEYIKEKQSEKSYFKKVSKSRKEYAEKNSDTLSRNNIECELHRNWFWSIMKSGITPTETESFTMFTKFAEIAAEICNKPIHSNTELSRTHRCQYKWLISKYDESKAVTYSDDSASEYTSSDDSSDCDTSDSGDCCYFDRLEQSKHFLGNLVQTSNKLKRISKLHMLCKKYNYRFKRLTSTQISVLASEMNISEKSVRRYITLDIRKSLKDYIILLLGTTKYDIINDWKNIITYIKSKYLFLTKSLFDILKRLITEVYSVIIILCPYKRVVPRLLRFIDKCLNKTKSSIFFNKDSLEKLELKKIA